MVSNILTNAVKYTEKGSVTLSIRNTRLLVTVKDTGIGIRPEDARILVVDDNMVNLNMMLSS